LRRYVVEHWYRFINRNLHWRLPPLSTPEQSQLWSQLMVLAPQLLIAIISKLSHHRDLFPAKAVQ